MLFFSPCCGVIWVWCRFRKQPMIHRIKAGEIPMDVGSGEKERWVGEKVRVVETNPTLPVCFHGHTRYFFQCVLLRRSLRVSASTPWRWRARGQRSEVKVSDLGAWIKLQTPLTISPAKATQAQFRFSLRINMTGINMTGWNRISHDPLHWDRFGYFEDTLSLC